MDLKINNNTLILLPQKALFWRETATLVISDLHVGKILHFRKAGIAVPHQALQNNFDRLDQLMHETRPDRVVFTGDVFHSDRNAEWDMLHEWRHRFAKTDIHFVLGNHDRLPPRFAADFDMQLHPETYSMAPFLFTHHPQQEAPASGQYIVCGHVHPVISLPTGPHQSMRFPCFHFGKFQAILPSFGYFTGGFSIERNGDDMIFAVVKNKIVTVGVF